jgi:2-polyprenyl-3-methyl-5-hydroxy-6-metoxy-1,4-benzoquinol methylase
MDPTGVEWTSEQVARFWDFEKTKGRYHSQQFGGNILSYLRRELKTCDSVLDYGCGLGHLVDHLLPLCSFVGGAEVSSESICGANERLSHRDGFLGVKYPSEWREDGKMFDGVIMCEVVEHLTDDVLDVVCNDMQDLLRPGGVLIVTTPNREDLWLDKI